nr:integrase, catalytic region, zinc finger, CCHC-type, peptidase aspartic, catalytic [Tanacetum cinerariifolium]
NGVNILKSIDEGPFWMGTIRETLTEETEGAPHLGPERPRVYSDLTPEEKERYNADIRAINIILQGLPKDIYSLINHYTDAKDIWDNVKMLLEGSELTKEDRLSPTENLIENLTNILSLLTQSYKTYLPQTNNQLKTSSNPRNQATIQYGRVVVQNVQGRQNKGQRNNARGAGATSYGEAQNKVGYANPEYFKDKMLLMQAQENRVALDEEQLLFIAEQAKAAKPVRALTVYPPNTHTCKTRITPTGFTEGERGFEQTNECYLTEVIPFFKTLKEHFEGIKKDLTKEIKEMKAIFDELEAEVDQNAVNRKCDKIERKNLLIKNDTLIANCLSKEVFYIATNSELNVSRFFKMHDVHTVVQARFLKLETKLSKLKDKIQKDDHDVMVKRFSNLEVQHLNLQLKYQHLKENLGNNNSLPAQDSPDYDSVFEIKKLKASIPGKDNAIRKLRTQISQLVENAKVKQHYKEIYDSIKITRAKHIDQTTALLNENENLKVQINAKLKCVTIDFVIPKVLAPGMYAIDVEPIPPRLRNNREVHLDFLKHLKKSVETLREIVEEAKVERPLDRSLASACLYTKHSQELLEYVIGTCPKDFNKRDKKQATTPLTRKKQVTFVDQCETLNNNTHKHVEQQTTQKTYVPMIPSIGVNSCTDASGSKPRSNTKKNRISSVTSVNRKTVEDHARTNKSNLKKLNRVDSSISSKRIVINSNSDSVVHIVIWYLDSGCSKHMAGDCSRLRNFVKKFIGTVRFRNDHFGAIMGYGDYVIGDSVISRVYYVEGLGHNLFSVGQFCNSNLEITFRKHSCYVQDTNGVELIKGSRGSNLYTISVEYMMKSSPIYLLSKASKTNSWFVALSFKPLELRHKLLLLLVTLKTDPSFTLVITKTYMSWCIIRSLILHFSVSLVPSVILQMTTNILANCNQQVILGIFVGYAPSRKGYRIYNKRTRRIMETIHVQFDELFEPMAHVQLSTGPTHTFFTPGQISSWLIPNLVPTAPYVPPTNKELDILFQPMFDEYLEYPRVERPVSPALAIPVPVNSAGIPSSTSIDQDAPSPSHSPSSLAL